MKTSSLPEKTDIEPDEIIGTKWVGWSNRFCDRLKVEFVDKTNCIYTSMPNEYQMTYTVMGGKLYISEINGPFELIGNTLFNGGLPVFEKAA